MAEDFFLGHEHEAFGGGDHTARQAAGDDQHGIVARGEPRRVEGAELGAAGYLPVPQEADEAFGLGFGSSGEHDPQVHLSPLENPTHERGQGACLASFGTGRLDRLGQLR